MYFKSKAPHRLIDQNQKNMTQLRLSQFKKGPCKCFSPGDSKWPFYPLIGGHLTIPKRSLNHPKKVTGWITWHVCFFFQHLGSSLHPNIMSLESTKVRSLSVAFCLRLRPDVQKKWEMFSPDSRKSWLRVEGVILDPPRTQQMLGDCMSCHYHYSYSHLVRVLCRWNPTARHLKSRIARGGDPCPRCNTSEFDHKKSSPLKILIPQPWNP